MNLAELMSMPVLEGGAFDPLPKGKYKVAVDSCTFGPSKNNKPMLTMDFVVSEVIATESNLPHEKLEGRSIRNWMVLAFKNGLHWDLPKVCDLSGNPLPDDPAKRDETFFENVAAGLVGATATIVVGNRVNKITREVIEGETTVDRVAWDEAKKKSKKKKASRIEL